MRILFAALAAVTLLAAADLKLGKPLAVKEPLAIATLLAHPAEYEGKTVQVKGKISAVCQEMGCWMELTGDNDSKIRIKVEDGEIVFPKDGAGKTAIAEGKFGKVGNSAYQIQGTGAVILTK
jgi:hypothetical protein